MADARINAALVETRTADEGRDLPTLIERLAAGATEAPISPR